jgi:cytidine deaminase
LQVFCAERVALLKALSDGRRDFTHVAVVAEKAAPCAPCGLCRQMLLEFAPEINVLTQEADGRIIQRPLAAYLPHAFRGPDA